MHNVADVLKVKMSIKETIGIREDINANESPKILHVYLLCNSTFEKYHLYFV